MEKIIMKKMALVIAGMAGMIFLHAQTPSETRTVDDFTGIKITAPVSLQLTQGDNNAVVVETNQEALKDITTEVKDGILVIGATTMKNVSDEAVVKVTVKNLTSLDAGSTSNVTTTNQLVADNLAITASDASVADLDVKAGNVKIVLSGAAKTKLSGTATSLDATLSGASQLKAYSMQAEKATITASGASVAHVSVTSAIMATASGAAEVHYQGNPVEKNIDASGAASVGVKGGDSDTASFHISGKDVYVVDNDDDDERSPREKKADDKDFEFWSGLDFGVNGYLTADNKLDLPQASSFMNLNYAKSYMFGWNIWQKNIHIYRNNVNLGTGIGLNWYHYNFRESYSLQPDLPFTTAVADSLNFTKNRLNMCYVGIPLFLEFNTNNSDARNSFHIGAGVNAGYNVFRNKLKQRYDYAGRVYKRKVVNDFNVDPFRIDAMLRIGYGNYTIFGAYSLTTLFEKSKGPTVYPFSAGIHVDFGH
ncbi:MAG TPA: head GIN domain-containing protein [Bacteroidia bacterium]|nr:head GIN domain-containing protein [Bacteroidia bacterium]